MQNRIDQFPQKPKNQQCEAGSAEANSDRLIREGIAELQARLRDTDFGKVTVEFSKFDGKVKNVRIVPEYTLK